MQELSKAFTEKILVVLDEQSYLFPQFAFKKQNKELKLLGIGGFSSIYEMYNKERQELSFALKVTGFMRHTMSSEEFWNTGRIQWILSQESRYIVRILDSRELVLAFDDCGALLEVKDAQKEEWEENERTLHLQFVLMEKLDELLEKDRFAKVHLCRKELCTETEVFKFAFEIGQALAIAHTNKCLHRDIKIENVFWDATEQVYKLGDFGIARWTEDGTAETIAYTDGYGAPEIERRFFDSYNATADIYSFGITLYLLLNDLKFPGSDGYYPKVEVQYHPEFVFPAPAHASEHMAGVIRKMCSFYPTDRYQSMNEVLAELSMAIESEGVEASDELFELADIATETFREDKIEKEEEGEPQERDDTRAARKEKQKIVEMLYREDSAKYFLIITALMIMLFKGFQPDASMITNRMFLVLPAAVLLEALFQRIKECHLLFGTIILVFVAFSIYSLGVTMPHIILVLCILIGCPLLTMTGAISTGIWILLEYLGALSFLDFLNRWNLEWIVLTIVLLVVNRYFWMRIDWEKTTSTRAFLMRWIYDKMLIVMAIAGLVLHILQKCNVIAVPDIVGHMQLFRTGFVSFVGVCIFAWRDGVFEDDEAPTGGEELAEDDERLDE